MSQLLVRDQFREGVFARDAHKCVICGDPAQDAHHIMERRLFTDGGYYLNNGASVCGHCHYHCETTTICTERLREAAGIVEVVLPPHLYKDQRYDKWGNPILPNGTRLQGELFWDESVQKVLKDYLHVFTHYVKYPRTYHLPWSLGMNEDDRQHTADSQWYGLEVVCTLKMDGENTTMYSDHIHARSLDSLNHPSRNWVKNYWSGLAHDIPEHWRICGENLYASHSIHYDTLSSYFLGFSAWDKFNTCLGWDETLEWFGLLGIRSVLQLYRGIYDSKKIQAIKLDFAADEGYVLRPTGRFHYSQFRHLVGKFVRPNHVQTTKHWMQGQPIVRNGLNVS
jgi:hypothetical protein